MKCTIPEISWHNRDPVLSVDVQPYSNEGFYRLASAGTDTHVLIWHVKIIETGALSLEPVSDLTRHQRAVNVVRWSQSGQYLASGDDDANIIIWHQKPDDLAIMLEGDNNDKEKWNVFKILRGHKEDVYDICWSPDSSKLISGSVDNTAIIWDLNKGLNDNILKDHKGFVQGVAWDPLGRYLATLSSDRTCRVFNETGKQVKARISKGSVPVQESHLLHGQIVRYYHDDTLKSFFRRLTFSPDGNLIITPAGHLEMGENKLYTSYIYTIDSLSQPAAILPSPNQYTIAARCCPLLFQLHADGPDPIIALPYRMIFAIATRSSVFLYDTQQKSPFSIISNIHYTRLTDLTWSKDGRLLVISSTDGFCSLVTFEPNELGTEYVKEPETVEQDEVVDEEMADKRPSFLEKWTKKIQTSTKMEVDDDDIVEKENKVAKKVEQTKSVSKTLRNSPAKPIAVRRKPQNDQMNITHFLKSPKTPSDKKESKIDENKTTNTDTIPIEDDSVTEPPKFLVMTEDSNIKLVLEETLDDVPVSTENEKKQEKCDTENSKTSEQDSSSTVTNVLEQKCDKDSALINEKIETKDRDKVTTLTSILSVPKNSPAKKRVPLITLSSPKHKKKPF